MRLLCDPDPFPSLFVSCLMIQRATLTRGLKCWSYSILDGKLQKNKPKVTFFPLQVNYFSYFIILAGSWLIHRYILEAQGLKSQCFKDTNFKRKKLRVETF
jgi:hypothetical protein